MKKILRIILLIVVLLGISFGIYFFLNKEDSKTTLTILEKQWIEDNKNVMQDFAIANKLPAFNYDGEGLIHEFLNSLEQTTNLEFNRMSYSYGSDVPSSYAFMITDKKEKNDILIYEDNYALLTKEQVKIDDLMNLSDMVIGVAKEQLDDANLYLNVNKNVSFTSYDSIDELFEEYQKESTKLNAIIVPKTMYLDQIVENNYYIAYNITEMTLDYVIRLGDNGTLNNIIKKYYKKWQNESFDDVFGKYFTNDYFAFADINNDSQVKFKSKQYKYGFVNMAPYDKLVNGKLLGINSLIMKSFSLISDIEISFTQYNSLSNLYKAFNENKIDFMFDYSSNNKYDIDYYETISPFSEKIVIIANTDNDIVVNSIFSLKDNKVMTIANSKISKHLEKNNIEIKKYKTVDELISKVNNSSIIAIDYETYKMYEYSELKNYDIRYDFDLQQNYSYLIRDISANRVFSKYFDFYLSFMNSKQIINKVNYNQFIIEENNQLLKNIIIGLSSILVLLVGTVIYKSLKNKKKNNTGVSKENKLKYIDMLTSLKNRNYLNDSIEKWDEAEIYPQSIIIVDLNNIAYINDNYGHSEGDNVITEAANILIKNQLEQTEIMRTNGNEFLIYLVGYEEKQIVSYIRKLNKEFKELAHGFGAAIGYSMINDGLKTIDDAINEATLDMRTIKEETTE